MRLQLALNVADLDEAVEFYSKMFGVGPAKTRPGYANFAVDQPPLKLVLFEGAGESGTINHLGVETETADEVVAAEARLGATGLEPTASRTRCAATPARPRPGSTAPTAPGGSGTSSTPTSSRCRTRGRQHDVRRRELLPGLSPPVRGGAASTLARMSRSVYLTAMGPASGKSAVALGLVELLSRRVSRIGFFRPIVQSVPDNDIELIRARYQLADDQVGFAFTADELRELVSGSREIADAGMAQAVAAFSRSSATATWSSSRAPTSPGPSAPLEFDFNARVARHLGAPVLAVVNGHGPSVEHIARSGACERGIPRRSGRHGAGDDRQPRRPRLTGRGERRPRRPPHRGAAGVGAAGGRRAALPHARRARPRPRCRDRRRPPRRLEPRGAPRQGGGDVGAEHARPRRGGNRVHRARRPPGRARRGRPDPALGRLPQRRRRAPRAAGCGPTTGSAH